MVAVLLPPSPHLTVPPRGTRTTAGLARHRTKLVFVLLIIFLIPSLGYSVLTHEAIIDSMWVHDITPVLLKKFPGATTDELREAHGYAYGGSIIQDMGYYPFGSRFYSDLTHYARSGAFVETLLRDARDLNEYAFAIGALSHYWADNGGHPLATNPSVGILFPKLKRKFGTSVTYEESPSSHMRTEFGFDVLQVAQGHYASPDYHDFIGFKVAKPLLERAFKETYGIGLASLFTSLDLSIGTYRHSVSTLIPAMTRVAWQSTKAAMARGGVARPRTLSKDSASVESPKAAPILTRDKFLFNLSRSEYSKEWGDQYERPGFFARVLAFLWRLVPKIGPFKNFDIMPSNPETEVLFMRAFDTTTGLFRTALARLAAGNLTLENSDLDTGKPTNAGEYKLADAVYGRMLHTLAGKKFEGVSPALRSNITAFYRDTTMHRGTKKDSVARRETLGDLAVMRASAAVARPAGER